MLPGARCFRGAARRFLAWAALSLRSVRRRSAAGVLASVQLFGRGVLPRLFFLTAARKTVARRRFWAARRGGFGRRDAAVLGVGGAAVFGVGGAAAVFGVGGGCVRNLSAALSLRSVRRRVLSRALHRVLRRSFCVPDFAPDFYAGRAPELLIFL